MVVIFIKFIKKLTYFIILFAISFSIFKLSILIYISLSPKPDIRNANSFFIYDNKSNLVFKGNGNQEWVNLDEISNNIINATISIEDKNFFKHSGFDYLRIAKAIIENAKSGKIIQGASTITQQYSKNLFLEFDKSWSRKWKEMWITMKIEHHYSKEEILEGYLNTINYGHGVYGIENASGFYFNKHASELNLAEAAILVGIPNSPSNYSPLANYELSKARQKLVLTQMMNNDYITEDELINAYNYELKFYGKHSDLNLSTLMYYQNAVIDELHTIDSIPDNYLESGGIKIYTTLDTNAQTILENSITNNIKNQNIQTAAVLMNPSNGEILALVGGKDYSKSQYNRAIYSKRQPGSSIKPLLYYAALENGFTSSTTFISQKTTFNFSNGEPFSPTNSSEIYADGPISLAAAIAYSDNIYAVKTHLFLGEETLVNTAKRLGIKTNFLPVASLPLGSNEVSLLELVSSYSVFASQGYKTEPHFITKVETFDGSTLYEYKEKKDLILNPSLTFILSELLTGPLDTGMVNYTFPSCVVITNKLTSKYALKSGTTDSDTWLIGYNKNVVLGFWSGYDDNKDINSNDGKANKLAWADTIEKYNENLDKSWYNIPSNVVGLLVDGISGKPATNDTKNKKILYYLKGTEPTATDMVFDEILNN